MKKIYTIITLLFLLTTALSADSHQAVSLYFDGINDYVYLGSSSVLKPTTDLTVEVAVASYWGRPAIDSQKGDIISNTENGGYSIEIGNSANDGEGTYIHGFVRRNGSYAHVKYDCSGMSTVSSKRINIALVSNSNSVVLYINGNPVNTVTTSGAIQYNNSNATLIGAQAGSGHTPESSGDYFDGIIDEIRIWNVARDYSDIEDYAFNEVPVNQTGLVALYRFNQGIALEDNNTITALTDSKNLTHGVLKNFALTDNNEASNFTGWNALAPLSMVKDMAVSNISAYGAKVTFNRGTDIATNYAVFFKQTNSTTDLPPVSNDAFWDPYEYSQFPIDLGNGWKLVTCHYWDKDNNYNGLQTVYLPAQSETACKVVVYEYNERKFNVTTWMAMSSFNKNSTSENTAYFTTPAHTVPTVQTALVSAVPDGEGKIKLTYTPNTQAYGTVIFVKETTNDTTQPTDNTAYFGSYTNSSNYNQGTQIGGSGWYCVLGNTSTPTKSDATVTIKGFTGGKTYRFIAFAYNGTNGHYTYNKTITNNSKINCFQDVYSKPTIQAANISATNISAQTAKISWINGNGTQRVVFAKKVSSGNPATGFVLDSTSYTANSVFGLGEVNNTISNWYCIYNGSGNSVNISGLEGLATYRFMVCEYNGTAGRERYLITNSTNNPANATTTDYSLPTQQSSNISIIELVYNRLKIQWQNGNGNKRIIFMKRFNNTDTPSGYPPITNNTSYTAGDYGTGSYIGGGTGTEGWYCVYNGSSAQADVVGLMSDWKYRVVVADYNGHPGLEKYNVTTTTNNPYDILTPSGIENDLNLTTELKGNYPNPFNPSTSINYSLAEDAEVAVKIFDVKGNLISEPVNASQVKGSHSVNFDGTRLSSGIYFYSLTVNGQKIGLKKMNLIK